MDRNEFFKRVKSAESARLASLQKSGEVPAPVRDITLADVQSKLALGGTALEVFKRNFAANHGDILTSEAELAEFLKSKKCARGVVDANLKTKFGLEGAFQIDDKFDRYNAPDSYDFGISAASFAIAENGALVMKDKDVSDRMIAIAPWVHVAVLRVSDILPTITEALEKTVDCPYAIWVGGPSKTTDVEGVLVEGVHGPGVQACLLLGDSFRE